MAPRSRTAAPPMAMPAMAPVDKDLLDDAAAEGVVEAVAVGVLVDVGRKEDEEDDVVGTISEGKYSPGLNIKVAFLAYASCISKVSVAF